MHTISSNLMVCKNKKNVLTVGFCILGATLFTYMMLYIWNVHDVFWDTEIYWSISQNWDVHGLFSFKEYPIAYLYRGYFFPWFLSMIKIGAVESTECIWIVESLMVSLFCMCMVPYIIQHITKVKKISVIWRCVFLVLFLFFYRGIICYPLSDFFAFFFCLLSIFSGIRAIECIEREQSIRGVILVFLCSYCGVATYYIRANYIFFITLGLIILLVKIIKKSKNKIGILETVFAGICGVVLVTLPQILINYYATSQFSPFVMTEGYANVSLFDFQLYYGLLYQKYETYIGIDGYQSPGMYFLDPIGSKILRIEGIENAMQLGGLIGYLKLVLKYPFDFVGIFARHAIAMLDIRYPEVYVKKIHYSVWTCIINYSVLFFGIYAGIIDLKSNCKRGLNSILNPFLLCILICVSSLTLIPGAIETRFGIGLWCTICGFMCFSDWGSIWKEKSREKKIQMILLYMIFLVIMFTLGGAICGTLQYDTILYCWR